ncbi:MAG: DinB family protein [Polyangiales bacterium]
MSLRDHFLQMARNNAWSNLRIYDACRKLDAAALSAPRTSYFPSLFATLRHVWIVDEYYADGLEAGGRGAGIWEDEEKWSDLEAQWCAQQGVDARLVDYCARLDEASLSTARISLQRREGLALERAADVLAHLFVHQIHHRGQIHAMLSGTSVMPPQLDEWFLAADRPIAEAELRASVAHLRR